MSTKKKLKQLEEQELAWLEISKSIDSEILERNVESEIVHELVNLADKVQTEICQKADKWKIELFAKIVDNFGSLKVGKAAYFDLVHMSRMKRHSELSLSYVSKLKKVLNKSAYFVKLKSSKLSSLTQDSLAETVKLPVLNEDAAISILGFDDVAQNEEFVSIINEAADLSHEISKELYPKLYLIYAAFCHYTKDGTVNDIKHLVDIVHYRYGGFPSETSPPRHWSTFKKFRYLNILSTRYNYDFAETWNHRFGLIVQIAEHKNHAWKQFSELADKWQNLKMFKIAENKLEAVKDNFTSKIVDFCNIDESSIIIEHIAETGDYVYIVVNDTYQIVRCFLSQIEMFTADTITTELGKDFSYSPVISYAPNCHLGHNPEMSKEIVSPVFTEIGIHVNDIM